MNHKEQISKNGYYIFDETKINDTASTTPIDRSYGALALCLEGEITYESNMHTYHLTKGECLIVNNILYKRTVKVSDDFKGRVLVCNNSFMYDSIIGIPNGLLESIYVEPIISIDNEEEWRLMNNYFDNLGLMQDHHLGTRHMEFVALTFRSIVLLMASLRGSERIDESVFGHSDIYYRNFIELISEHIKQEHEVKFYADRLHISAKYLNELCKLKGGHKAKQIITSFLISKIKQEMIMSGKSIKTIAYDYGFSDQSSLGKFFTKATGMSPGEFRKGYKIPRSLEE